MPSVSLFGQAPRVTNIVLREQFTGDGSTKTFQLTSSPGNCTFNKGAWAVSHIRTAYPAHCTGTDKKPTYDSVVYLVRNRIGVTSIDSSGLVTLDYAPRNGVNFYVWYWYQLQPIDEIDTYREDFVASMEAEASAHANEIVVDTSAFNGILSVTDTTLQVALNTIDDHLHDGQTLQCDGITSDGGAFSFTTSGTLTFSNTVNLTTCANAGVDTDKFLVLDASGNIDYRTGAEVLSDIGGGGGGNDTYIEWGDAAQVNSSGADLYVDFHGTDFTVGTVGNEANVSINFTRNWSLTTVGTHEYQIGGNRALAMPIDNTNIAIGCTAGNALAVGATDNIAVGYEALLGGTITSHNIAIGQGALRTVTTPSHSNIAIGYNAGYAITTSGYYNVAIGRDALRYTTTGDNNIAIGYRCLYSRSTDARNIAIGYETLYSGNAGSDNVAIGYRSMRVAVTGNNVAIGNYTLQLLSSGSGAVAIGKDALAGCTTGDFNTAIGQAAAAATESGEANLALGYNALFTNVSNSYNVAIGARALYTSNGGEHNVAIGYRTWYALTTGDGNLGIGYFAGYYNETGSNNVLIGKQAGEGVSGNSYDNNIAIGSFSLSSVTTGSNNICIGYQAGDVITTGGYNIIIGYDIDPSAAGASNELNIGGVIFGTLTANQNITINATTVSVNYDLMLAGDGVLGLKETTTPTADTNYGKLYCKNDDKLYFQDGAGNEHELAYA